MIVHSVFFHADIDAFFASVEQIDDPRIKGKPVIIGALPGGRGVVSSCSYEARAFGITSAMPISIAYRKCPHGVYLPVRMERYAEFSKKVMDILEQFTPSLQQISIDEALLDMTGMERLLGPPLHMARKIKRLVKDETKLTISIGIAPNKYLAKIASDIQKPDGLYQIKDGSEKKFLQTLPLKAMWGLGEKTLTLLREYNITTMKMLQDLSLDMLCTMCGKAAGCFLYNASRGKDPGIYQEQIKKRSISSEVTFEYDRKDVEGVKRTLLHLAHEVIFRLIHNNKKAKTVSLKLRFSDFNTINTQITLKHWISSSEEVYKIGCNLLKKKWDERESIRLVGISLSNLEEADSLQQRELFEDKENKEKKVEHAIYRIKKKLGKITLTKAHLLEQKKSNGPL
jgi:DNA polymerase-4